MLPHKTLRPLALTVRSSVASFLSGVQEHVLSKEQKSKSDLNRWMIIGGKFSTIG